MYILYHMLSMVRRKNPFRNQLVKGKSENEGTFMVLDEFPLTYFLSPRGEDKKRMLLLHIRIGAVVVSAPASCYAVPP